MSDEGIRAVGRALSSLLQIPVHSQSDLSAWYEAAARFRDLLNDQPENVLDSLPHELEHFLVDADIRLRDREYAWVQESRIRHLAVSLEAGLLEREP